MCRIIIFTAPIYFVVSCLYVRMVSLDLENPIKILRLGYFQFRPFLPQAFLRSAQGLSYALPPSYGEDNGKKFRNE